MLPNSCNSLTIVYEASVNANCCPVTQIVSDYFFWEGSGGIETLPNRKKGAPRYAPTHYS
jgi:hypothetical protein